MKIKAVRFIKSIKIGVRVKTGTKNEYFGDLENVKDKHWNINQVLRVVLITKLITPVKL